MPLRGFAGLTDVTFRQLSERRGIPLEIALAIRQATGSSQPEPDDRVADYARQNEVLVSEDVVAASAGVAGVEFEPIGPVELKGLTEAVSLHVARRAT